MTLEAASPSELHVPGGSHISWIHASDKRRTERQDACGGGLAYIMILTEMQRRSLLGVNGAEEVQKEASWKQYVRGDSDEVMQCRITQTVQAYKIPEYGDLEKYGMYRGQMLTVRPILNSKYDLAFADGVPVKPKMVHEVEKQLNESINLMGITELKDFPKVIIASDNEMGPAVGTFDCIRNQLAINVHLLDSKWVKEHLSSDNNRLSTLIHELYHWKDAQKYMAKHGKITDFNK